MLGSVGGVLSVPGDERGAEGVLRTSVDTKNEAGGAEPKPGDVALGFAALTETATCVRCAGVVGVGFTAGIAADETLPGLTAGIRAASTLGRGGSGRTTCDTG